MFKMKILIPFLMTTIGVTSEPPLKRPRSAFGASVEDFNRLDESMTEGMKLSMEPLFHGLMPAFGEHDRQFEQCTPRIPTNDTHEMTPYGVQKLGKLLLSSPSRVSFQLENNTTIIYEHDCFLATHLAVFPHPLVRSYLFLREAGDLGFIEDVLFISPPTPLGLKRSLKTNFQIPDSDLKTCAYGGASVRYAIIAVNSNGRVSFETLIDKNFVSSGSQNVRFGFSLGAELIGLISKLHSRGVLHGKLTPADVVVERNANGTKTLKLAHISHATGFVEATGESRFNRVARFLNSRQNIHMSPWELRNRGAHFYSRSDDVFRAVEMIASLVNPGPDVRPGKLLDGTLASYKMHEPIFDRTAPWNQGEVAKRINRIEMLARLKTPRPHYIEIFNLFVEIMRILERSPVA